MNNTKKPKRRRYKDNPYFLQYEGKYEIKVITNTTVCIVPVSEEVYEEFNKSELHDLKEMNEYDRHITHFGLSENDIYKLSIEKEESIEDNLLKDELNDEIHEAINKLSDIQKERIIKYYFQNKKLEEIAKEEGTSFQAVSKCINLALKNLKEILKNMM